MAGSIGGGGSSRFRKFISLMNHWLTGMAPRLDALFVVVLAGFVR